jgi:hypothetical protein
MDTEPKLLPVWQDWLKAVILLGMGVYFVFLVTSGNLVNYINIERVEWVAYVGRGCSWRSADGAPGSFYGVRKRSTTATRASRLRLCSL